MEKKTEDGYRVVLVRRPAGWQCCVTPPNGIEHWVLAVQPTFAKATAAGYAEVELLRAARRVAA